MKSFVLSLALLFALTSSHANNPNDGVLNSSKKPIEKLVNDNGFKDLENIRINIIIESASCTVKIKGSVKVGGSGVEVEVSATAETCEKAVTEAVAGVKKVIKSVKEVLSGN